MHKINALILLCAAAAIAAAHFGIVDLHRLFKPLTTILIILGLWQAAPRTGVFARMVLWSLVACLAGDTLLMFDSLFLFGMLAFLLGHLGFTLAFVRAQHVAGGWQFRLWPLLLLLLPTAFYYRWLLPYLGDFAVPVGIYSLVIVVMSWQAISLLLARPAAITRWLALGAVLFMFSDGVIAANKFVAPVLLSSVIILTSYWLSIWLIARVAARWDTQSTGDQWSEKTVDK